MTFDDFTFDYGDNVSILSGGVVFDGVVVDIISADYDDAQDDGVTIETESGFITVELARIDNAKLIEHQ